MLSHFSHVQLFATLCTIAGWDPLSMGFSRQVYWSGLPYPPPENLLNPGIEPVSLPSPALAGRFFTTSAIWEAHLQGCFSLSPRKFIQGQIHSGLNKFSHLLSRSLPSCFAEVGRSLLYSQSSPSMS